VVIVSTLLSKHYTFHPVCAGNPSPPRGHIRLGPRLQACLSAIQPSFKTCADPPLGAEIWYVPKVVDAVPTLLFLVSLWLADFLSNLNASKLTATTTTIVLCAILYLWNIIVRYMTPSRCIKARVLASSDTYSS
jgi:hypothetical protein